MARRSTASGRPRLKHRVEYALLRAALALLSLLPLGAALWCGRRLADFAFDILRLRRAVTLANLERAFGGSLRAGERRALARSAYRQVGMSFCEVLRFPGERPESLLARASVGPDEILERARGHQGGLIYLTAHTGNWELFGTVMGLLDRPLATIVAAQRNPLVDRWIKRWRARMRGMVMIERGSALRGILRALGGGGRVGIAGEQDAGPQGLFLPFLGRPASTAIGPARFAYRSGAMIVIGFDRRLAGGRHAIELHPPLFADRSRPEEEETLRILSHYTRLLEDFVRRHPDQWFWMHRRWKTRPPGEGACAG
ncbi:MAG: hypothetical protein FJY75_01190 [Candidatus Eisenbacteria bacterium]|uniref:Lysophospholipid acyltransferase family protein n=1 Tax=Eiseniibacteriota bacterium TaxID=2212470 RepID=A0A937X8H6_UNCEI|nr:hypothetical protein [Candidatus Eisenbacteria bacterium]